MDAVSSDPALFKYLFDLNGFVVVPDVLDHETCDAAIAAIEARKIPMPKTVNGYESKGTWESAHQLWEAGEPFITMIDLPKIIELLKLIIGPLLRLETAYSFVRHKGGPPLEMHGGHRGGSVNFRYNVVGDSIYTGLTVVGFSLQDISEQSGGFACVPGSVLIDLASLMPNDKRVPAWVISHKSDFHVPEEYRPELWALEGPSSLVRTVATPKGSAVPSPDQMVIRKIHFTSHFGCNSLMHHNNSPFRFHIHFAEQVIFTETLAHGAAIWQEEEPRYSLFFKYNDRAAVYGYPEERRPIESTFALMNENQRSFFNRAWSANVDGKPANNPSNTKPEFGRAAL